MTGDNLRDYECPEEWLNACNADCSYRGKCVVLPVFRAHIKLRADHDALRGAVLGDMTPEKAAQMYRTASKRESGYVNSWGRFNALADVVARL